MPAYLICLREGAVLDTAAMGTYQRMNREQPAQPRPTPLVVYGAIDALEGAAPDGVVVLQFPTVEDARAWYHSPEYQAALPHRKNAADHRVLIVQGV